MEEQNYKYCNLLVKLSIRIVVLQKVLFPFEMLRRKAVKNWLALSLALTCMKPRLDKLAMKKEQQQNYGL